MIGIYMALCSIPIIWLIVIVGEVIHRIWISMNGGPREPLTFDIDTGVMSGSRKGVPPHIMKLMLEQEEFLIAEAKKWRENADHPR